MPWWRPDGSAVLPRHRPVEQPDVALAKRVWDAAMPLEGRFLESGQQDAPGDQLTSFRATAALILSGESGLLACFRRGREGRRRMLHLDARSAEFRSTFRHVSCPRRATPGHAFGLPH